MEQDELIAPQWIRFTHKNGEFAFEFDPLRGIARCVKRGGTVEYDLVARMAEARRQVAASIDATANSTK